MCVQEKLGLWSPSHMPVLVLAVGLIEWSLMSLAGSEPAEHLFLLPWHEMRATVLDCCSEELNIQAQGKEDLWE